MSKSQTAQNIIDDLVGQGKSIEAQQVAMQIDYEIHKNATDLILGRRVHVKHTTRLRHTVGKVVGVARNGFARVQFDSGTLASYDADALELID